MIDPTKIARVPTPVNNAIFYFGVAAGTDVRDDICALLERLGASPVLISAIRTSPPARMSENTGRKLAELQTLIGEQLPDAPGEGTPK